ncbi:MAG: ABC transporter permease [Paracoccaceae bacterium]|nr:MAG: ABC transporter permease [Alphaproteobacteria bacterium]GIX12680.1 MAG: ABC transporter permease [Paracoccaceae bacterium]
MKRILTAAAMAAAMAVPAGAELVVPSLDYRTGPYAPNGIPYADGFHDYLMMLNERDGGIGGERIRILPCETGYNTEKGVECYEATKGEGSLVYHPLSTGITYQLIPKATADHIPVHSMGYGRTSAANGRIFEWIFNFPGTYWDAASIIIKHILQEEGGDLSGKRIALLYHNSAYGKEPIRTLEELARKHGYELSLLPVDHPGQEQKSQWLQIRRERPDWVIMWGWGVMNQVAIQEAANIRYPMDHFVGVWWSGSENDVRPAGKGADGYKAITWHFPGADAPVFDAIRKYVIEPGKNAGDGTKIGEVLYARGVYAAITVAEAIRTAQRLHGTAKITPPMMRDGLENLEITAQRWEELGWPGLPPIKITCANHGAPGLGAIQQWNAAEGKWTIITPFMEADREVIDPLIIADSEAFAKENGITPRSCE